MTAAPMSYRETVMPAARRDRRVAAAGWLLALAAALVLYGATMAPDLVWLDAGDYQLAGARMDLERPGEAVRVHPLFVVLAHGLGRVGLWNYAQAASVASAIGTAVAVANVWLLVWLLVRRVGAATVAAAACMLAHTIWQLGVQPQTYGWSNAAVSGMLVLAVAYAQAERAWLVPAMGLVGGVGLSLHVMSQAAVAVLGVWILVRVARKRTPAWVVPAAAVLWVAGAGLFWYVALQEYHRTGDVAEALRSAFVGGWGGAVFNLQGLPTMLARSGLMLVLNFPTPLALLGLYGLWRSRRVLEGTPAALVLGAVLAVYVVFAARYRIAQPHFFFTPAYMMFAVYVGLGVEATGWAHRRVGLAVLLGLAAAVVPAYVAIETVARRVEFNLRESGPMHEVPYRDAYAFYLLPWQHTQTGPRRFAEEALASLPERAILLPDTTVSPPLKCLHDVEQRRPDVLVADVYDAKFDASLRSTWTPDGNPLPAWTAEGRRVFVTADRPPYIPAWVAKYGRLEPHGLLFEVRPREAPASPPAAGAATPSAAGPPAPSAEGPGAPPGGEEAP